MMPIETSLMLIRTMATIVFFHPPILCPCGVFLHDQLFCCCCWLFDNIKDLDLVGKAMLLESCDHHTVALPPSFPSTEPTVVLVVDSCIACSTNTNILFAPILLFRVRPKI